MPRLLVKLFEAVVCSIKSFPSRSLGEASDLHDIQSCPLDLCLRRPPAPRAQQFLTCGSMETAGKRRGARCSLWEEGRPLGLISPCFCSGHMNVATVQSSSS